MVASDDGAPPSGRCAASSGMAPHPLLVPADQSTWARLSLTPGGLYDGGDVTTTTQPQDAVELGGRSPAAADATFTPEPGGTGVEVPLGRRVMVVSDLLLRHQATPSTSAVTAELARALDTWDGPGILIIAGNLFDLTGVDTPVVEARRAIEAHPALAQALAGFLALDERRVIRQTGTHEPGYDTDPETVAAIAAVGVEQMGPVDLHLHTVTGERVVRVEPGQCAQASGEGGPEAFHPGADAKPGLVAAPPTGSGWRPPPGSSGTSGPGCRRGPSAMPTRPTSTTRSSSPHWWPWWSWWS